MIRNTPKSIQVEAETKSTSSPTRSLGPLCIQIDAQDASDLRFGCFTYAWKAKEISFSMPQFLRPTKIRVDKNYQNKLNFHFYPGQDRNQVDFESNSEYRTNLHSN
jgi:hypothetical protein